MVFNVWEPEDVKDFDDKVNCECIGRGIHSERKGDVGYPFTLTNSARCSWYCSWYGDTMGRTIPLS